MKHYVVSFTNKTNKFENLDKIPQSKGRSVRTKPGTTIRTTTSAF